MRLIRFPGYPDRIGEPIEFPDISELIAMPMFSYAEPEWVLKNGNEFQKYLLDKAPLTHEKKYVHVFCQIRFVYQGVLINIPDFPNLSPRNEWHSDGIQAHSYTHTIANSFGTEFNTKEFELEIPDDAGYSWFIREATFKARKWGLTPKPAPLKRFVTVENHIHRAPTPNKSDFRFFFRVIETNDNIPRELNQIGKVSVVYDPDGTAINNIDIRENGNVFISLPSKLMRRSLS